MKIALISLTIICGSLSIMTEDPETKLMTPTTWDDYYGELYNHPIILVTFYESKESSEMAEKILTTSSYLRNTEFIDSRDVPVMVTDMSLIPKVKSFYDFETSNHLWLFVRNRAYKFEDFEKKLKSTDSDKSISDTYDWVVDTIDGLIKVLRDEVNFEFELDWHGVITVYMGEKNENYDRYVSWVLQYSKEPLYAIFKEELREYVIKNFDKNRMFELTQKKDVIAVIWSPDALSEIDSIGLHLTEDFEDQKNLDLFYLFETQPKIRKNFSTSDNVFMMYQRHLPLFLFNYKEDADSSFRLKEFNKAIKILPKRFIFDLFEHESRRAIDYQHIMIQSSNYKLMEPNSIYIMWLSHGTRPQIMKFDRNFNADDIVSWTFNFGKMFPHLFGNNEKKEQFEQSEDVKLETEAEL